MLGLHARKRCADAEVDAVPECMMIDTRAIQAKGVGIVVMIGVPVGSTKHGVHRFPFGHLLAVKLDIMQRIPADPVHRRLVAQALLNGYFDLVGIVA